MNTERIAYLRAADEAGRLSWEELAEIETEYESLGPLPERAELAVTASDMLDEIEAATR